MRQHLAESLQDKALLAQTQNISSLRGLLNFCVSNPAIDESCSKSGHFWRESLMRLFGKTIVLQRGDIAIEDWFLFTKTLATGRVFEYTMRRDTVNGTWSGPEPFYAIAEDPKLIPDDIYYEPFKIPVAVPTPGTQGYFVRWSFDGTKRREINNFFVGSDLAETWKLAQEWIAVTYYEHHVTVLNIREADFFTNADYHQDEELRKKFPTKEELVSVVLANQSNADGTKGDLWFTLYGKFYGAYQSGLNQYSESAYDIVPITF